MKNLIFLIGICLGLFTSANAAGPTLTTLHVFQGADGAAPVARLAFGTNGNLYGVTSGGGASAKCIGGCGTIFEITPDGAFTSLYSFTNNTDGSFPRGGMVSAFDGFLYGTTSSGGASGGLGTVFRISTDGVFTNLHTFRGTEGISPDGTLIQATNGMLYGITSEGGQSTPGTVYGITTNGVFGTLGGVDQPAAGVIMASDGFLYGTTEFGGDSTNCNQGCGTVFKISTDGVVTTVHSFNKDDGRAPRGELVEGANGVLYGTTSQGGTGSAGTIFQITTNGEFTLLHSFVGPEGKAPNAGLTFGNDGNLYGTASGGGGALAFGTIFQMTTNGVVTKVLSITSTNGAKPMAPLVLGPDGAFYGTTEVGGLTNGSGQGTVFKLTISTNTGLTCVLSPSPATNMVGTLETVIATVSSNGVALVGVNVGFSVISGPNAPRVNSGVTDSSGQASFSYTGGSTPGVDKIRVTCLGSATTTNITWVVGDSVGDGIPDWWRAQYFGGSGTTTNAQSCAMCDADRTGQNNLFKYVAGLNPTNSASVFTLSALSPSQSSQMSLTYGPIASGRTYRPEFTIDLVGDVWTTLTGFTAQTNAASEVTITDPNATDAAKFYRVSVSLP
jgi:uncharacterized repeat protein (TIGR03803 family)